MASKALREEHHERQQSQQRVFRLLPLPLFPVCHAGDLMFMLGNNTRVPNVVQNQLIWTAAGALPCVPADMMMLTWYLYNFCLQLAKTTIYEQLYRPVWNWFSFTTQCRYPFV